MVKLICSTLQYAFNTSTYIIVLSYIWIWFEKTLLGEVYPNNLDSFIVILISMIIATKLSVVHIIPPERKVVKKNED